MRILSSAAPPPFLRSTSVDPSPLPHLPTPSQARCRFLAWEGRLPLRRPALGAPAARASASALLPGRCERGALAAPRTGHAPFPAPAIHRRLPCYGCNARPGRTTPLARISSAPRHARQHGQPHTPVAARLSVGHVRRPRAGRPAVLHRWPSRTACLEGAFYRRGLPLCLLGPSSAPRPGVWAADLMTSAEAAWDSLRPPLVLDLLPPRLGVG